MLSLGELAQRLDLTLSGDAQRPVSGLATLAGAGPQDVSFLSNRKYLAQLESTNAGAVILHPDYAERCPVDCLVSESPYLAFAHATQLFDNSPKALCGIHPSAVIAVDAEVAADACVGPNAVLEAGSVVGSGAVIGANAFVGQGSRVGAGTVLHPGVTLYHDVYVGERCIIHSQTVIGADGFGFSPSREGWVKVHQLGGVRIGDRVEIGACTAIDRGALEPTVIEDGVIIDNLVQIAHNCHIGKNTAIAACTGIAGSTIIGANCTFAGQVGVDGHLEICDGVHFTGMTMVTKSITEPGSYSSGVPMAPSADWRRSAVRFQQLDSMHRRVVALEKTLK